MCTRTRAPAGSFLLTALLGAATAQSARADGEYLVQDLGQTIAQSATDGWFPPFQVVADGVAYSYRDDAIHGRELWRTDGTALGTYLVRDVCPGVCGAELFYGVGGPVALLDSLVFFTANDGVHGSELWVTDGTAVGTRMVVDLQPGHRSSEPIAFHAAFGQVFFIADDGTHGRELWRSDGTAQGTQLVFDFAPGAANSGFGSIFSGNGLLYFRTEGSSLWRSDGTLAGTLLLHDTVGYPTVTSFKGAPFRFLPDGTLLFQGCASPFGQQDCELWRSDGTATGTLLLADLNPGPQSSYPSGFFQVGSEIWFSADDPGVGRVLFRSDGTPAGTQPIPMPAGTSILSSSAAEVLGNALVFTGCDAVAGCEPWFSDGVTTTPLGDLWPGFESSLRGNVSLDRPFFVRVGALVLFVAEDDTAGLQLWRTNGTPAGTWPISALGAPPPEARFGAYQVWIPPTVVASRLLLYLHRPDRGVEIWSSDGTVSGTTTIRTIADQSSAFVHPLNFLYSPSRRRCFEPLRQGVMFTAFTDAVSGTGALEFSDGAPDEVTELAPIVSVQGASPSECATNGSEVLAWGGGGTGPERGVWRSDGSPAGTDLLLPLADGTWPISVPMFERFGDSIFFAANGLLEGIPRGATDPSAVIELPTAVGFGTLRADDERLFFGGFSGLEVTDGESDPVPLVPSAPPDWVDAYDLVATGERLFFVADTPAEGLELWSSDGSPAGTAPVRLLRPGPEDALSRWELRDRFNLPAEARMAATGVGRVVFAADDGVTGNELWASDGTAAGTVLVADIDPGPDGSWPRHLVSVGSVAYFAAEHPKLGLELYRTDGTAAGTSMVRDLVPGIGSSVPEDLTVQDGILYFSAWTPAHGRELWRSDGSFQGTHRLTDVAPGPLSSSPTRFVRRGNRLFFVATDQIHGFELWARADDGSIPIFIDGVETGDTARWSAASP